VIEDLDLPAEEDEQKNENTDDDRNLMCPVQYEREVLVVFVFFH
jgi:hypothetical protein